MEKNVNSFSLDNIARIIIFCRDNITNIYDVIDFTKLFEEVFFDKKEVEALLQNGMSYDDVYRLYYRRIKKYFLYFDHYTAECHQFVATELFNYLLLSNAFQQKQD